MTDLSLMRLVSIPWGALALVSGGALLFVGCGSSGPSTEQGGAWEEAPFGEQCDFGDDADKCGGYEISSCLPVLEDANTRCEEDADCPDGALCFASENPNRTEGDCLYVVGECRARCGGNFDCRQGSYCDPKSGECVDERPVGLEFGAECDLENDECRGECIEISDGVGECEELCRVGAEGGCGESELAGSGVACAYFAYDLSDLEIEQGNGDTGICANLCECNDDCSPGQRCYPIPTDGYAGICTGGIALEDSIACGEGGGSAGSGGR